MTFGMNLNIDMLFEIPIIKCNDRITITDMRPAKGNLNLLPFPWDETRRINRKSFKYST